MSRDPVVGKVAGLTAFAGLPGTGKTTRLIHRLQAARDEGRPVRLFLCRDSEELRSRPHLRDGGTMGCRTPNLGFRIDHFVSARRAVGLLADVPSGSLAAFDEASWFGPDIVDAWSRAERRGVEIVAASISEEQAVALEAAGYAVTRVKAPCMLCGIDDGKHRVECFVFEGSAHVLVCEDCRAAIDLHRARGERLTPAVVDSLVDRLRAMKPFPNEARAYQPLYGIDLSDWGFVRPDTRARAELIWEAFLQSHHLPGLGELSFLDAGCCTGFFCEFMAQRGLRAEGMDVDGDFVALARRITELRGSGVEYHEAGLVPFIDARPDVRWDVVSSFATVQWVLAQSGSEDGLRCFDWLLGAARRMCVIEIGYTAEKIYKDKLPFAIDRSWVLDRMRTEGEFDEVLVFKKGTRGIWRDLFVGIRAPTRRGRPLSAPPRRGLSRRLVSIAGRFVRSPLATLRAVLSRLRDQAGR